MLPTTQSALNHSIQQTKKVCNHEYLTSEYKGPPYNACNLNYHAHAFLFNMRNYSDEVINIQRRKVLLNINLLRVNDFDIEQKMA